ncbi:NAD(P)H-binding protein [Galbibacter sp.]|jgi:nucleoside-diphosphate-sugar epimerase|uniref:NAD(P)H-binding protein n=1 Tax=Galbibacter sp. TaxID=2918471 RepID=UPI003A8C8BFD
MHILVVGASGRVGKELVSNLLHEGHQVTGTTRQKEHLFKNPNYRQIELNLKAQQKDIEISIPKETEAIYFVSGSRGKDILQVDLHGAVKTMIAAEKLNIKRYIMLSALHSLEPEKWTSIVDYFTGKYFADLWLINQTNLDYTIVQPGSLTETPGTGKIDVTNLDRQGDIAIKDVATALKEVLTQKNTYKKMIPMLSGSTSITEVIANYK